MTDSPVAIRYLVLLEVHMGQLPSIVAGCVFGVGMPVIIASMTLPSEQPIAAHVEAPQVVASYTVPPVQVGAALPPPPTEVVSDDNAEAKQKGPRKAWFKELHSAPPGVDYKAVERLNGLAQIRKRNRIATEPQPITTGFERWVERGSNNQAGRMHVATYSSDGETLYAGSSKGGVWKRDKDGGWLPIGDNLYGGAHWLITVPGEGDVDVVIAATDGGLLHVSDDDGVTWNEASGVPEYTTRIRRLVKASDGSHTLYGVFGSGAWEDSKWTVRYPVLRSTDAGRTWTEVENTEKWAGDIWVPRNGGSDVFLVKSNKTYRSVDAGDSWTELGAFPRSFNNAELVGSEAGAPRLWSIARRDNANWLLRSDDAGASWTELRQVEDKWTGTLAASIIDQDLFAWGGVELWRTFDGGDTFAKQNKWGEYYGNPETLLHADLPGLDVIPDGDGELWYVSTDGGLYESKDSLKSVRNISLDGLRVSQYYGTLTSAADTSHVAAGAQDQGYQTSTRVLNGRGDEIRPEVQQSSSVYAFNQSISGDYAHLTSSDGTHEVVYSVYPGFVHVDRGGEDAYQFKRADYPADKRGGAWLPPVVADPADVNGLFFCAERLFYYSRNGDEWTPALYSQQNFKAQNGEYISGLVFSPVDDNRAYVATNKGRLFYSSDKGKTWTQGQGGAPSPQYFYGSAIAASPDDVDTVYVGGSGYGENPAIIRSTDGGKTWQPWNDGMPQTLVYTLTVTDDGRGEVFAGGETAAYRRLPDATEWTDITGADAPVTTYWSSELVPGENAVRFGTYGRGIWDYLLDPEGTGCLDGVDADDDGVLCHLDCDDADASVFPGAEELCDGIDSNCDGVAEVDADEDGYWACDDCDDNAAAVNPGAEEVRGNDIDDDCDGESAKKCGCQSSTLAGSAWWLSLPLLALALRRRR